ncbi:Hypothetical predicted protein [Podarcis lilfordi]|uniref:Uncharacterized protein n=1 Tax=Podarcis lilfordi TaxID=74358 RepID=A0AA35JXH5_9SAUR|nr:Hypothetical predicted protein [Podarcis lilfordi]
MCKCVSYGFSFFQSSFQFSIFPHQFADFLLRVFMNIIQHYRANLQAIFTSEYLGTMFTNISEVLLCVPSPWEVQSLATQDWAFSVVAPCVWNASPREACVVPPSSVFRC